MVSKGISLFFSYFGSPPLSRPPVTQIYSRHPPPQQLAPALAPVLASKTPETLSPLPALPSHPDPPSNLDLPIALCKDFWLFVFVLVMLGGDFFEWDFVSRDQILLSHEWQAYISRTHKLRKIFVSVEGIYYQAEVEGQKITWLQQVLPDDDVVYDVLLNFLEFYETLLALSILNSYHSINVKYLPILDPHLEASAAGLLPLSFLLGDCLCVWVHSGKVAASNFMHCQDTLILTIELLSKLRKLNEMNLNSRLAQLQHQLPSIEPGALMQLVKGAADENEEDEDTKECKKLLKNMKFFSSREVPRESLLFVIPAFGGVVSWKREGAPFEKADLIKLAINYSII
ncbi:pescadillo homolog [Pistacia vera]|uniref:pescadillo homolog n=1 Tax=Pistacia vera TaxID=55513 RepID=UPI001262F0FA|nr:pescadillo homolog [Pistacia vera]